MTNETLARELVPIAAELVGTVRDFGPDEVRSVLASVPAARYDALAVVLAAMVDPDRSPADLLAWTTGMARSRENFEPGRAAPVVCADCGLGMRRSSFSRHRRNSCPQAVRGAVETGEEGAA